MREGQRRGRAAGRTLVSAIPPYLTAKWYNPAKVCTYCRAILLQRLDVNVNGDDVPMIRVRHEAACPAE